MNLREFLIETLEKGYEVKFVQRERNIMSPEEKPMILITFTETLNFPNMRVEGLVSKADITRLDEAGVFVKMLQRTFLDKFKKP